MCIQRRLFREGANTPKQQELKKIAVAWAVTLVIWHGSAFSSTEWNPLSPDYPKEVNRFFVGRQLTPYLSSFLCCILFSLTLLPLWDSHSDIPPLAFPLTLPPTPAPTHQGEVFHVLAGHLIYFPWSEHVIYSQCGSPGCTLKSCDSSAPWCVGPLAWKSGKPWKCNKCYVMACGRLLRRTYWRNLECDT